MVRGDHLVYLKMKENINFLIKDSVVVVPLWYYYYLFLSVQITRVALSQFLANREPVFTAPEEVSGSGLES